MKHPHLHPRHCAVPINHPELGGRRLLSMMLWGWIALALVSCEGYYGDKAPMTPMTAGAAAGDTAVLAPGDTIKIFFPGNAEYTSTQKIATDGNISLPYAGVVHVAGKRIGELQSELSDKFESQLENSEVVVTLEVPGSAIIVSGGVRTPGKFNLDRPTSLLEAIFMAGGFNEFAKRSKVRLIRISGGHYTTKTYDLGGALHGKEAELVYLKGGDLIEVEERTW